MVVSLDAKAQRTYTTPVGASQLRWNAGQICEAFTNVDNTIAYERGVRLVCQLCLRATDNSLSSAARLCFCVRFQTRHNSKWSESQKMRGKWKKHNAVVWSAFFCSGACRQDSPRIHPHALESRFAAAEGFVFCVVPLAVCGTLVFMQSRETLSMYVRLGCTHATPHSLHSKKTLVRVNSSKSRESTGTV